MKTFFARFLMIFPFFSTGYWLLATGYWPPVSGSSAQAASADDIVKRLQERYDTTTGFRADFVQEVESATLGQKVESRGTVYFQKPGRMRWEFNEPSQLLVSDGVYFWFYQPKDNQVLRAPFQQSFRSTTPVSFLTGVGRLDEEFTAALQSATDATYVLRLTPKKDAETIGLLDFEVSAETYDILQATVIDPLGNTTRVRFANIDRTSPLNATLFRFTVPEGVDVIEAAPAAG
jgi:outer membrane lipoprotein carrier protein